MNERLCVIIGKIKKKCLILQKRKDPMRNPYPYIYVICAILCLISCNHHSSDWETVNSVETYIEEKADSALTVLQNINSNRLKGREEKARYALLLSMAMDKNFIDKTNFEVLQPAIDYYEHHGTATDKLRTLYY